MSIDPALTSPENTALAGPTTVRTFLDYIPRTGGALVATALINQASFSYPIYSLIVDNTSAGWSGVTTGMVILIGTSSGASDIGIYRVRTAGDATHLYPSETSEGDPGLIPLQNQTTRFADNLFITILNPMDVWAVIPYIDYPGSGTTATIYEDRDIAYAAGGNFNSTPGPCVNITMNGKRGNRRFRIDSGQTYATVVFVATPITWPPGLSISSYAWTIPGTWTVIAGSVNSSTFTARIPAGTTPNFIQLVVTDASGGVSTVWRNVRVYDDGTSAPMIAIAEITSDVRDRTGRRISLTLNDNAIASIPDGVMCVLWEETTANGSTVPTISDNFTGWILRQGENSEGGLRSAEPELVGPAGLMALLRSESQYFETNASPSTWQQMVSTLMYVDFIIFWMVTRRAYGLSQLFDYQPMGISNLNGKLSVWRINAGTLLSQVQTLAQAYLMSNFGCDSTGSIFVRQDPNMMDSTSRNSIVERGTITASIASKLALTKELRPRIGKVRGEAFYSDGTTNTPLLSDAPGNSPGQAAGEQKLAGQVVDGQNALNTATGMYYAKLNNPCSGQEIEVPFNWDVLEPAQMYWARANIDAAYRPVQLILNLRFVPQSVSKQRGEGGTATLTITPEFETSGPAGVTVPVPQQISQAYGGYSAVSTLPVSAATDPYSSNGATVFAVPASGTATLHVTANFFDASPVWRNISGTGLTGNITGFGFRLDPWSPRLISPTKTGPLAAYYLTSVGVYYCTNILASTVTWTLKQSIACLGAVLRTSINTQGLIYVCTRSAVGAVAKAKKLSSYGATIDWQVDVGTTSVGNGAVAMDIDNYGADEMLVGTASDTSGSAAVYRVSGGVPTKIAGTEVTRTAAPREVDIRMLQKPLKTPSGADNRDTGGSEFFVFTPVQDDHNATKAKFYKTTDGGATLTSITATVAGTPYIPGPFEDVVFGDSASIMAFVNEDTSGYKTILFTSRDGGTTWTQGATLGNAAGGVGYFPRTNNGSYALYLAGVSGFNYSPDFGNTVQSKVGNYGASAYLFPLY